jgi:1,4-alpha-glucan branching enzyme
MIMLRKYYSKTGGSCRVTFDVAPVDNPATVSLCGDFNDWSRDSTPMKQRKDGKFSTTISLRAGRTYRFKYLFDGGTWINDSDADGTVTNEFGTEDSLVKV